MWIYKPILKDLFKVGFLETCSNEDGSYTVFNPVEEYHTQDEARKAVNYLNGGNPEVEVSGVIEKAI